MARRTKDGGFTLIEILVVVGIIGLLLGIAVPAYTGYRERSQIANAMSDLKRIETAIIALALDTGLWPEGQDMGEINDISTNEIYDLSEPESGLVATDGNFPNWNGPYIPEIPLDPWGNRYFMDTDYQISGVDNVVLGSYGPEAVCNNCYNDTDIRLILPLK